MTQFGSTTQYTFTVGNITVNFDINYNNDVRPGISALSNTGIVDADLLAAASAALAQFTAASNVIDSIDAAVQFSARTDGAGLIEAIYGSTPIYNSFQVNGSGILANENQFLDGGRVEKVMTAFPDAVNQLWLDAIKPFLAEARNVTSTLPVRLAALTAAIAAASPSSSKTAAQGLLDAMGPISDAIMGVGTADPFSLLTRDRVLPFAMGVLPNLQNG